jgi:hypothetical protein
MISKPLNTRFKCKTKLIKCKICGKPMTIKLNKLRGSVQLSKNRVTCSTKCSKINAIQHAEEYQKEWRAKQRLKKKKENLFKITAEENLQNQVQTLDERK